MACSVMIFTFTCSYKALIDMKRGVRFMYHSEDAVLSDATGSQSPTDLEAPSGYVQLIVCD